jgi:transcriptional regulator with XRE-family HTH domain
MGLHMHIFQTFRESHNLSQTDLGALLGFDRDSAQGRISHYETGRREVPVEVAHQFIKVAREHGDSFSLESVYPIPGPEPKPDTEAA